MNTLIDALKVFVTLGGAFGGFVAAFAPGDFQAEIVGVWILFVVASIAIVSRDR